MRPLWRGHGGHATAHCTGVGAHSGVCGTALASANGAVSRQLLPVRSPPKLKVSVEGFEILAVVVGLPEDVAVVKPNEPTQRNHEWSSATRGF